MMSQGFINYELLKSFSIDAFRAKSPFPWHDFHNFLTPEGFQKLYQDFPTIDLFEKHNGLERHYGQRPHNRYYLAYEKSLYKKFDHQGKGIIKHRELPKSWQMFIEELETSKDYQKFIKSLFEISNLKVRYAWHVGVTHSEVSPHRDSSAKIGTHILYFNTSEDWELEWGGSTLVLGDKSRDAMNPDFTDFNTVIHSQLVDNHSFLFQNTPDAWHGVKTLTCPEGKYRRLFNVIFEFSSEVRKNSFLSLPKQFIKKAMEVV